jgi:hypothetical protein
MAGQVSGGRCSLPYIDAYSRVLLPLRSLTIRTALLVQDAMIAPAAARLGSERVIRASAVGAGLSLSGLPLARCCAAAGPENEPAALLRVPQCNWPAVVRRLS